MLKPLMNFVPWRIGKNYGAVVCNVPCRENDHYDAEYGGYLVCESVGNESTKRLIAAVPEMHDLLQRVVINKAFPEDTILGKAIMELLDRIATTSHKIDCPAHSFNRTDTACNCNCPF